MKRLNVIFLAAVLGAIILAGTTRTFAVFIGDIAVYQSRIDTMIGGAFPYVDAWPYVETDFEHLPLSLLPLLTAHGIGRILGDPPLGATLSLLNTVILALVLSVMARAGNAGERPDAARRWLFLIIPLLPVLLFRLDPVSLLFASAGLVYILRDQAGAAWTSAALGVAARGWPVVLAWSMWRRRRHGAASMLLAATALMAAGLLLLPGFREPRAFAGIHVETVAGSLLATLRLAAGADPSISVAANAQYVDAAMWVVLANGVAGAAVVAAAFIVGKPRDEATQLALLAYGVILVSPLLSAQFVAWPTIFVALTARGPVRLVAATGALTTLLLLLWAPMSLWWETLLVLRNGMLLVTPLLLARASATPKEDVQASISRRNLPV